MKEVLEEKGEMTFEDAMQRLEEVVRRLETQEMSLEESIGLFQEGIGLSKLCQLKLEQAEGRIERVISEGFKPVTGPAPDLEEG